MASRKLLLVHSRCVGHMTRHCFSTSSECCKKQTHYDVLKVKVDASNVEIKDAFLNLSKQIHPDKNKHDPSTHDKFIRLHEAYTVLSKPSSRREYDFGLAASIKYQRAVRNVYESHTPGSSYRPGAGPGPRAFYDGDQPQEQRFWDEKIFEMRDKSKDKDRFYDENSYYGIRGMKRRPNSHILGLCFLLIGIGSILHVLQFRWSYQMRTSILDKQTAINYAHLRKVRERARLNGNEAQLEIMTKKMEDSSMK